MGHNYTTQSEEQRKGYLKNEGVILKKTFIVWMKNDHIRIFIQISKYGFSRIFDYEH